MNSAVEAPPETDRMTTVNFLSYLRGLDVKLWLDEGRLRYSAPNGVMTEALRARIVEHKPEIVTFLSRAQTAAEQTTRIQPVPRHQPLPLSFAQQRLWFLEQLAPGNTAYNISQAIHVRGSFDIPALQRALTEIRRRHEVLRTTFPAVDGQPVQEIMPPDPLPLPLVDIHELAQEERDVAVQRMIQTETQRPFDLERGPLVRATLVRLAPDEHVVLFIIHHIIGDAWSMGVLVNEVVALYDAFANGRPSPLPDLPIQYADFAHWQREWLQGETLETQLDYWREQLRDAPALLDLPTDRPRPARQSFRGDQQPFTLSKSLSAALKTLSQQENVTLFMTLLAAFKTLLHRYTHQDDVLVGTAIANRNRAEIEGLIGFFVNTLVLRTDLSAPDGGSLTFRELLGRVREVTLGAYAHQDLPFETLVSELRPERDLGRAPLFQVGFQLQNAHGRREFVVPGLQLRSIEVPSKTAKFDLTLSLTAGTERISGSLEYSTDLFDGTTITRMLTHFQTLLEGITADPDQRLSDLPLLSQAERQQILVEWNETAAPYPHEHCIHELFEAQVARTPDAVALVFEDEQISYRALNRRANQLAHHLRSLGVGPEVRVGICVERSPQMIVALLAVLKAGGAYIPLDPNYPPERLSYILADAEAPVLMAQSNLAGDLSRHAAHVLFVDDQSLFDGESGENLSGTATPDNLAYVIYTSGSTGKPKGVMLQHRGVCNMALALRRAYHIDAQSHLLQFASFSFDASVEEIFTALVSGATLHLVRQDTLLSEKLIQYLRQRTITKSTVPPSMLAALPEDGLDSLETIVSAGEHCTRDLALRWARGRHFINGYGPTEATVCASHHELAEIPDDRSIPIGRPIQNVQLYVLDRHLQPVPVGVAGELHVGGVGLARGYLNRPNLTAEKFIPHPFSTQPGARLYKTGDLVRYRADGSLEFLGRIDHQVKIRGFRIELGEIEAALAQHPQVQDVLVLARTDTPGRKRLVAYLTPREEATLSVGELRSYLAERLPDYMVPSTFVTLDALPLTPNGKVDRQALPAPDASRATLESEFVAPRTPAEETLAEIWRQVLGIEQVGVHDNFFELGGDSMRIMQIVARAKQRGLTLTPAQIVQYRTVAELVQVAGKEGGPAPAEQGLVTGSVPLTPIQRWFFAQNFADPHHWNWAFLRQVPDPIDPVVLAVALRHLLHHHDALRLRFHQVGGEWQAVNADMDEALPLTVIDLSTLPADQRSSAIETAAAQAQTSLDLDQGPLLRIAYFDCGEYQADRILVLFHHLVVDVVSTRILLDDLQTLFTQLRQGEPVQLPPKSTSFQTWARRLAEHAQSDEMRQEADDWIQALSGEVAPLPLDFPDGINSEASADLVVEALSADATDALLHQIPGQGYAVQEVLLTALVRAFGRWRGEPLLLVEMEGHGREQIIDGVDISRTVGWFTSVYPVRFDLRQTPDPRAALHAVYEQMLQIPNRGIGFGLLRYLCQDESIRRQMEALPAAQINFNYLGQLDQGIDQSSLPLRGTPEYKGPERSLRNRRTYPLYVVASVRGGVLRTHWNFSANLHRRSTIQQVALWFNEELRALIEVSPQRQNGSTAKHLVHNGNRTIQISHTRRAKV